MVDMYSERRILFLELVEHKREKFSISVPIGLMASETTGSGMNMEVCIQCVSVLLLSGQHSSRTIEKFDVPSVNVSQVDVQRRLRPRWDADTNVRYCHLRQTCTRAS